MFARPEGRKVDMEARKEIPRDDCWQLLANNHVGRVALSMKDLPRILPVQYYVNDDETIAICLGTYRVSEQSGHGAVIAFAADDIDPVLRSGWSVQAVGRSTFEYADIDTPVDCGQPTAGMIVRLEPDVLNGQWLSLCPFMAANTFWDPTVESD